MVFVLPSLHSTEIKLQVFAVDLGPDLQFLDLLH